MPTRGTPTVIPEWWLAEIQAEMTRRGWQQADLALALVGVNLADPDEVAAARDTTAHKTAKTRVSRFFDGKHRTRETADEIARHFPGVPSFTVPPPLSADHARELDRVARDPSYLHMALAAKRLFDSIQSGREVENLGQEEAALGHSEERNERQGDVVKPVDEDREAGAKQRRPRGARAREKAPRSKQ